MIYYRSEEKKQSVSGSKSVSKKLGNHGLFIVVIYSGPQTLTCTNFILIEFKDSPTKEKESLSPFDVESIKKENPDEIISDIKEQTKTKRALCKNRSISI